MTKPAAPLKHNIINMIFLKTINQDTPWSILFFGFPSSTRWDQFSILKCSGSASELSIPSRSISLQSFNTWCSSTLGYCFPNAPCCATPSTFEYAGPFTWKARFLLLYWANTCLFFQTLHKTLYSLTSLADHRQTEWISTTSRSFHTLLTSMRRKVMF